MKNPSRIRALFIDVDDTLVRFKKTGDHAGADVQNTGSLGEVFENAAVELAGLSRDEARQRIARIKQEVRWWHWSDFVVELDLDAKRFWDYAFEAESRYLEATGPEIPGVLARLKKAGYLLYISSNNPSSGILHKLRVAGLAHNTGSEIFHQLLGATELHAMKWDALYWKKALGHTALSADECMVIGDNLKDDFEVPAGVGFAGTFLIRKEGDFPAEPIPKLFPVRDFGEIESLLIGNPVKT
ncbi:MAG: HAD family hydrolase [Spirochaetia bacterium]|nr:HAD family hydrolase [Spirochaetia bacterium]